MKETQCLNCGNFNLLSRHTCEYCGSPDLKVIEISKQSSSTSLGIALAKDIPDIALLGPAFLQCGKITGFIKDGVTLCGKPMMHTGDCK